MRNLKIFLVVLAGLMVWAFPSVSQCKQKRGAKNAPAPFTISDVAVSPRVFNPTNGETVTLTFRLSQAGKSLIKICDPDMGIVRELMAESPGGSAVGGVVWDGKDSQGRIVPDEAYLFTMDAADYQGRLTFNDPATYSGGDIVAVEGVRYDPEKKAVVYDLSRDARVKVRAGVRGGGPLLKNIVSGAPRASGHQEEPWDGMDESRIVDAAGLKELSLSVEAVSLWDLSVISRGNTSYDYFQYSSNMAPDRPKKLERPRTVQRVLVPGTPVSTSDRMIPEPRLAMELPAELPSSEEGPPVVSGKVPVRIRLDDRIKRFITEQRYEIVFFLDFRFVREMEEGYSPFTLMWDTRDALNGNHLLTVNVATLNGQVGTASARVFVKNEKSNGEAKQ